ncbi:PDZ domain-containing protein [Microcella daejeonensis]|uniref:endopeptidase La n=1 Tax=Microcella daejeonensis TaxID=2994971 RepID=A0A9E8SAH5_9MICO|nr:S16 family serine protease [Microcella daejeonensis]WAB80662.1 PDZ domain-containing protein [Microcella daejeonensis]WAB82846.1 PDZ domain-containing protein [Microcella daejeonensis]
MSLFTDSTESDDDLGRRRGGRAGWLLLGVTVFGLVALALLPSPYVIERPGPVFDTLGTVAVDGEDVPLITIPTEPTYDTEGSLSLLTVTVAGNPERLPSWFEVGAAWLDPQQSVVPADSVFPAGVSTEDRREQSRVEMENSQQEAVAAALRTLGEPYESTLYVVETTEGGPAEGLLEADDRIISVNGEELRDVTALRAAIAANGTSEPAVIGIEREGRSETIEIVPEFSEGENRVPVVGILVAGEYEFPFEVEIELENVGGPSAGMMFALGIIDKLTPDSLAGGAEVAGTGTIAADGAVGPIGGIVQKMYGALDAGAEIFLAPRGNCDEVVGAIPDGLDVIAVSTLDEAVLALQSVADGDDPADLPRCG